MTSRTLTALLLAAMATISQPAMSQKKSAKKGGAGANRGGQEVPAGVQVHRDIEYAQVNGKSLHLDLYIPEKAEGPLPLAIYIHGGGWRNGSKSNCRTLFLTEHGYAAASIGYRLSGEATFPAQIHDCKAAVRWLRANATKYNLDPDRFGAWGPSAGGHLVALLGTSGDVKELEGNLGEHLDQSSRIQAVADWFGPTDLLQMDAQAGPNSKIKHDSATSPEGLLIGGPIQENKEKAALANPIHYVTKDDPPFLIAHGDQDPAVPVGQSQILHDALKEAEIDVTLQIVKGAGHGKIDTGDFDSKAAVKEFFDKHLEKKPALDK